MNKTRKKIFLFLNRSIIFILIISGIFYQYQLMQAATNTFIQTNWNGGATANNAVHPTNQTGWTQFSTSTNSITASNTIILASSTYSFTDDVATSTTSASATGGGFANGTNSSTTVIVGNGYSIILENNSNNWATSTVYNSSYVVGTYTSIVSPNISDIYISYYNTSLADLEFAKSTDFGSTWATSTVDSMNSTGLFTSIAAPSTSTVYISYWEGTNLDLKFASSTNGGSSWTNITVDSANTVGRATSIAAPTTSKVYISYKEDTNAFLKFASSTDNGSSWVYKNIGSTGAAVPNQYTSIAAPSTSTIYIAYYNGLAGDLEFAKSTDFGSTWATSTIDSSNNVGQYVSIAAPTTSTVYISYYDATSTRLLFAKSIDSGSTWATSTVDIMNNTGLYTSIAAPSTSTIYIAYYDAGNSNLKFASSVNGGSSWAVSTIDNSSNNVGQYTSIAAPTTSTVYISYYDVTNSDLMLIKHPYYSSGAFESATIDLGGGTAFNALTWNATTTNSQTGCTQTTGAGCAIKIQVAAGNSTSSWSYIGPDGTSNTYFTVSGEAIPSSLNNNRYFRYKVYLATNNINYTPYFNDISLNYSQYAVSGDLTSSAYNTNDATNILSKIQWSENLATSTDVKFQLRTSSNGSSWSGWCGPDDGTPGSCNSSTYFTNPAGTETIDDIQRDGSNDRWIQYKAFLTSAGGFTPTLSSTTLTYVVNAAPDFDAVFGTNGVSVSQNSTETDYDSDGASDLGKVLLIYSIRDIDTNSGTTNPGKVQPSFEYRLNVGSSWTAIATTSLSAGAYSLKDVSQTVYTATSTTINASTTSALWNAAAQLGANIYSTTTQIRVIVNDNELANSAASSTSAVFTLDTKAPTAAAFTIDSSAGAASNNVINYNLSDDSNLSFIISNNSNLSADGSNASSGIWIAANATSTNSSSTWILSGAPNEEKVYYRMKDVYGNTTATTTITAPAIGSQNQSGINLRDISNTETSQWQEFISWTPFTATSGAVFSSYQLYRSTGGTNYSQLTTINSSSTNYYTDSNVSSSTTYYYKIRFVDTDGDISEFSAPVNDYVDGQGGTDITAPLISNVQAAEIQATWAKITWTTDEYSDSKVEYSASAGVFTSSSSVNTIVASTTPHSVYLTGLAPNITYYYRVKSKDVVNNEATDPASGNGYSFTTISGPIISNVSCAETTDNSATIIWNTNTDSNSQVDYSVSSGLTNATSVSSGIVGTSTAGYYQHKIAVSSLTQGTVYYFRVRSTDASNNISVDNNNGSFYQCRTTRDTKPPTISNILTPIITDTAVVIIWTTDERSTSQVEFGTASASTGNYASSTTRDNALTISHVVALTGLTKLTQYYYRVKSYDMNPDSATTASSEQTFTTADERQTVTVYVSSGGGGGDAKPAEEKDTTPPTITNIKAESLGAFEAAINFETNEESLSFVEYGRTSGYGLSAGSANYNKTHRLKIAGLKMGAEYNFKIKAVDKAGNINYSENQKFTTKYAAEALEDLVTLENAAQFQEQLEGIIESVMPSLVPPVISNIEISDIAENSAIVRWRTNVPSYGTLAYAAEKDYDANKENPYITEMGQAENKIKNHTVEILGLSPSTLYHFQVKSFSLPGVIGKSADKTFITKASLIKPEISKLSNTSMDVRWITDIETTSFIEYRDLKTGKVGRVGDASRGKNHSVKAENLNPDTSYEIKAFGYDANNNIVEGNPITVKTKKDITPPEISSVRIDNALLPGRSDRLQTVVSWRTNEPANSVVYFEEGIGVSENLANKTGQENEFTTDHIVIITNFKPSTVYRIKMISVDESKNTATMPMRTILTPRSAESVVDVITRNLQESFGFLRKLKR